MFQRIKQLGQNLVQKHGAEVGAVVRSRTLIPGAPLIVAAVESACDYAADRGKS